MFNPRPAQQEVLTYTGGKMGVSAVPGSGKTHTLSYLAAQLIAEGHLRDDQEILIVTLVNSAVDNFSQRVSGFIQEFGLLPGYGYRVRTLHGLANDIVRERPDLAGVEPHYQIVDEREASLILRKHAEDWLKLHPEFVEDYTNSDQLDNSMVMRKYWPELAVSIAGVFIRSAKDLQKTPADLHLLLQQTGIHHPLLDMGLSIYTDYQHSLNYRSALDFDDLIRLALRALQSDPAFLARLRDRWPYILEDEAQDSSRLQEEILRLLAGENGNWVRVGDPNQAIYETFTTASPAFLRNFMTEPGVQPRALPNSGRSAPGILYLANYLIRWSESSDFPALQDALTRPYIEPTPPGDPQPNPPDSPNMVYIHESKMDSDGEIERVVNNIVRWLPGHPDWTVAILGHRNDRAVDFITALRQKGIETVDLTKVSFDTRKTAGLLATALKYLAEASSSSKLAELYHAIRSSNAFTPEQKDFVQSVTSLLKKLPRVEDYLWPRPDSEWQPNIPADLPPAEVREELAWFAGLARRWQNATPLPPDQLLLTIAGDLLSQPADLALSHKLALMLETSAAGHPESGLPEFATLLAEIASERSQYKLTGFQAEETGFDPDQYKGKVVVATLHKAKGLEWDRVYLTSVNDYDFPSGSPGDQFMSEKWFIRSKLNLEAETRSRLEALVRGDPLAGAVEEGVATYTARMEYAAERLRLLFVGLTRARREVILTWNNGRKNDCQPAVGFKVLQQANKERLNDLAE